jgi:DNA-3-methyladenine glycosylase I
MTEADVLRLMQDPGIIRARTKIEATITGAKIFLKMQEKGEDLADLVWGMTGGKTVVNATGKVPAKTVLSEDLSKTLKKRGYKFVGPVIVYAWLQGVGVVDDHSPQCFRRKVNK